MKRLHGTVIVDPPWPYRKVQEKYTRDEDLGGYASGQYDLLNLEELAALPVRNLGDYCFLWTTPPFDAEGHASALLKAWRFKPITAIYWIKTTEIIRSKIPSFIPRYGVGYWFRGAVEPILIGKKPDTRSFRTPYMGLLSPNAQHSRKPNTLYEIIETHFPQPWVELFATRKRTNWIQFGLELKGDDQDIRISLKKYGGR